MYHLVLEYMQVNFPKKILFSCHGDYFLSRTRSIANLKILWWSCMNKITRRLKLVSAIFLSKLYSKIQTCTSKTMKNAFYFKKALFVLEIFKFLYFCLPLFFSLSAIALEVDPRKILKFMTSSTV